MERCGNEQQRLGPHAEVLVVVVFQPHWLDSFTPSAVWWGVHSFETERRRTKLARRKLLESVFVSKEAGGCIIDVGGGRRNQKRRVRGPLESALLAGPLKRRANPEFCPVSTFYQSRGSHYGAPPPVCAFKSAKEIDLETGRD